MNSGKICHVKPRRHYANCHQSSLVKLRCAIPFVNYDAFVDGTILKFPLVIYDRLALIRLAGDASLNCSEYLVKNCRGWALFN